MSNHHRPTREKFYSIPNVSSDRLIVSTSHVQETIIDCSTSKVTVEKPKIFFSRSVRWFLTRFGVVSISFLLATFCCQTIYRLKIENFKQENSTRPASKFFCRFFQTKLNIYYKIPANYVSLSIVSILIFVLIVGENLSKRKKFFEKFSMPMIFNSHSHVFRFQSGAVFGIIALEILNIFDEYVVHGHDHFQHGPLIDLIVQFGIGILLGLRYFPILSIFEKENFTDKRIENSIVFALASIYLYSEIVFKIQSDVNCPVDQRKLSSIRQTLNKLNRFGRNFSNLTEDEQLDANNELQRLNYEAQLNEQTVFYNVARNAPFYYFIVYLAVCLTILFVKTISTREKKSSNFYQNFSRWKYVKNNLFRPSRTSTNRKFSKLFLFLNSLIYLGKTYLYEPRPYFRYSKLIICIYTGAFTLIYYFTFWIQDHTYLLTKKLLLFLNLILCGLADLSKDLCYNLNLTAINRDIERICLFTAFVTCLQLFFGLRHYQRQMCSAYRGSFTDIPTSKQMSSVSIISKSVHYPGRFIGQKKRKVFSFFSTFLC